MGTLGSGTRRPAFRWKPIGTQIPAIIGIDAEQTACVWSAFVAKRVSRHQKSRRPAGEMNSFIFRSVRLLFTVRKAHRLRSYAALPGIGSLRFRFFCVCCFYADNRSLLWHLSWASKKVRSVRLLPPQIPRWAAHFCQHVISCSFDRCARSAALPGFPVLPWRNPRAPPD